MTMITNVMINGDREQGSTLIVALVMLLLISLIAVGSMQDTILQERMASNTEDRSMAFEGAEAALRAGEADLGGGASGGVEINPSDDWSNINDEAITRIDDRSAEAPSFHLGEPRCPPMAEGGCPVEMFDVTARGVGGRDTTVVLLQTTFGRVN